MDHNQHKTNRKHLYKQVQDYLLNRIENGSFISGNAIPTEMELCDELNVSRYTVRRAIQELVHQGYLYRVQGSGTFVMDDEKNSTHDKKNYIGVVLTHCEHEMEAKILSGIENALQDEGYRMTFMSSADNYRRESEYIQRLKRNQAAGLIIMPAEDQKDSNAIFDLKDEGFPFVLVDRRLQDCETDCVMSDNIAGGYLAAEHLIELGHKKIGFVKRKFSKTSSIEDRVIGYKNALEDYELHFDEKMIFCYDEEQDSETSYSQFSSFVYQNKLTAVISVNDYTALDIIKMCRDRDITIPDDLSLVGFDDLEFAKHLETPLTTIAQSSKKVGCRAAKLLIQKIKNPDPDNIIRQFYLPIELVVRSSSRRL